MDDDLHKFLGSSKKTNEIAIGDNVWIGAGVFITKGVHIGKRSIIAANTVVTKNVPENVLFAGNPGRVVKENIKPSYAYEIYYKRKKRVFSRLFMRKDNKLINVIIEKAIDKLLPKEEQDDW
jgi:tetrahydrodipicolinate N-succinyltransferase